jgi:hypothetical protein
MSTYAEIQLQLERERFLARLNQAKEKSSTSTKPSNYIFFDLLDVLLNFFSFFLSLFFFICYWHYKFFI